MIFLGIDPGLATIGFGLIKKDQQQLSVIEYGCIKTPPGLPASNRLNQIATDLKNLLAEFKPDYCSVEKLFFAKNTKTALLVAEARGVILQTLSSFKLIPEEYTPLQIKIAVTGYGQADKKQVQNMTKLILKMATLPKSDDAADALACAICHAHTLRSPTIA